MQPDAHGVQSAEVVLPCPALDDSLAFFGRLGFRVDAIFPAHDPAVAVISGHGLRIRLQRDAQGPPAVVRLCCADPAALGAGSTHLVAPNGTRIELVAPATEPALPPLRPSYVVTRIADGAPWIAGRAGMQYRDLIPDRQGGRFLASHIRIAEGGPVPDYVHFHRIHLQLIYCCRGWIRVVYEDQGPPFVLRPGDCVLQPPRIRHRVLESAAGSEVIEISSPAEHETLADHGLELPTAVASAARSFDGQLFSHHRAEGAVWRPWTLPGFESREIGIAAATAGRADARVLRRRGLAQPAQCHHDAELRFLFVLAGAVTLRAGAHPAAALAAGDAAVVPAGEYALADGSPDLELLQVTVPGPRAGDTRP